MVYVSGCEFESLTDGKGVRSVIFFSGCKHNCEGCHSPQTHSFINGMELNDKLLEYINSNIDKRTTYLSGITLSGGDPMYSAKEILEILPKLHIPKNDIWIYSGFTFEEICDDEDMFKLLNKCNVLVDGRFNIEKRDITHNLPFRGSSNQRIWKNKNGKWELCNKL